MTPPSPKLPSGPARWWLSALPRNRRVVLFGVLLLVAATTAVMLARAATPATGPATSQAADRATNQGADQVTDQATGERGRDSHGAGAVERERPSYPRTGTGDFTAAPGDSPVRGTEGPVRHYRVAVEQGIGQDAAAFAATVDEVLADPRSWIASEELRVRRVAQAADADFTVYLATPATSERMCAEGGLSTEGYTSCQLPGQVIINLARWLEAVPDYGAPLEIYRAYLVNHEVGHEFGEGHQACPGPGEPAPVMQQQTYGLDGCAANAWPYVDGSRYDGEFVPGT
ncbi:DUF3152 domain-containing protein [Micromonospora peucetia]|uniref:DUF3152 domain-containing protein n=1 Tax=Micromonospora peucetia TaxID=47871 RepID=UPI003323EDBF